MSRIITLITVIGAALAVAAPAAFGQAQPDPWSDGMNKRYGLGVYSPEVRAEKLHSEGLNKRYGLGEFATTSSIEVRERGMGVRPVDQTIAMLDAREQAFATKRNVQLSAGTPPDAFERALGSHQRSTRDIVVDDRFTLDPSTLPTPVAVTGGSGDEIQWPQVGVGFGVGMALILGLLLAIRATRHRPLAH